MKGNTIQAASVQNRFVELMINDVKIGIYVSDVALPADVDGLAGKVSVVRGIIYSKLGVPLLNR